jgi:hypothetical protein
MNPVISRLAVLQIFMLVLTWGIAGFILKGQSIIYGNVNSFSNFFRFHGYAFLLLPILWTLLAWWLTNFARSAPNWVDRVIFGMGFGLVFAFPALGYLAIDLARK